MVNVIKRRAGSDSHGNTWAHDGDVVDVEPDVAAALINIPDGGFELAPDEELPAVAIPGDSGQPGGVPVHNKAGSEPDSGDVVVVAEEPAAAAETEAAADEGDQPPTKAPAGRRAASK